MWLCQVGRYLGKVGGSSIGVLVRHVGNIGSSGEY